MVMYIVNQEAAQVAECFTCEHDCHCSYALLGMPSRDVPIPARIGLPQHGWFISLKGVFMARSSAAEIFHERLQFPMQNPSSSAEKMPAVCGWLCMMASSPRTQYQT